MTYARGLLDIHRYASMEFTNYDRWGLKVFQSISISDFWDGRTTSGIECVDGTYYYLFMGTGINNKEYNYKGFLQLIR